MTSRSKPAAFTLLELLVVIAIIGTLMDLLMSAVQKVRAASERSKCANQLRQIGIGLMAHHAEHGAFPMGRTPVIKAKHKYPAMSWLTRILPYIEQEKLWIQAVTDYHRQYNPFATPQHSGLSEPVNLFVCISDPRGIGPFKTETNKMRAMTSYVGVLGTVHGANNGVLYNGSVTRTSDITDGSSNTLMVGERPFSANFWYGWWYAVSAASSTSAMAWSGSPD